MYILYATIIRNSIYKLYVISSYILQDDVGNSLHINETRIHPTVPPDRSHDES